MIFILSVHKSLSVAQLLSVHYESGVEHIYVIIKYPSVALKGLHVLPQGVHVELDS